jgi:forkhead protein FKH
MPKYEVIASIQYHNDKNAREHAEGIQAYAKLAGRNWTYYVKTLKINIGRPPDPVRHDSSHSSPQPSILPGEVVDIDLGPHKLVSRQHATIEYDSTEAGGSWQIRVNGRNGVKLDELLLKRGSRAMLASGNVLEIGGTQMMFVLPGQEPQIHQMFLHRAQLMAHEQEDGIPNNEQTYLESFSNAKSSSQQLPASNVTSSAPVPLAPAPPDYRRLSTPSSPRDAGSKRAKQSPAYNRGLLLETTENIDWSLDSSKDLKPPFSYATMIGQAILASDEEKLTLNMIYQWIQEKYAFYRHSTAGWQVCIRKRRLSTEVSDH